MRANSFLLFYVNLLDENTLPDYEVLKETLKDVHLFTFPVTMLIAKEIFKLDKSCKVDKPTRSELCGYRNLGF